MGDWISITDQLPEIGAEVIVFCPRKELNKVTALARYIPYEGSPKWYWENNYGGGNTHIQKSVTHWMPLPEPPKQLAAKAEGNDE